METPSSCPSLAQSPARSGGLPSKEVGGAAPGGFGREGKRLRSLEIERGHRAGLL
jgi:hypothetical protein